MSAKIQLRRGTAADLHAVNPVLLRGEPIHEIDTGKFKLGDGVTAWNDLPYANPDVNLVDGGELARASAGTTPEFTPPNLSGLALWLDAADPDFVSLVNNKVAQWDDKSIHKRHFFQSLKANRPAASNTINDLSVVTFDGTNDAMLSSFDLEPGFTLFVVLNPRGTSTAGRVFTALNHPTDTNASGFIPCIMQDATHVAARVGDNYYSPQEVTTFAPAVYMVACDSASFTTSLNGLTAQTTEQDTVGTFTQFALGSSRADYAAGAFNGDIAEIVLYSRVLTDTERAQVEEYLLGRWGITQVVHPLLNGMTAFWPMNEENGSRLDISGSGNTLVQTGTVASVPGVLGNAGNFTGGANYLSHPTLKLTPSFTISGWFKLPTTTGTFGEIMQNWDGNAPDGQFVLGWGDESGNTNELVSYVRTTSGQFRLAYPALAANEWRHFVLSLDADAGKARLYVDNVLADSADVTGTLVDTTNILQVGVGEQGGLQNSVACALDSIGIWSRALSLTDIGMLWNGGFGKENFATDVYGDNVSLLLHMNKSPNNTTAGPVTTDALLLHFDGSNGGTTFTDSGANALTTTATGGDGIQLSNTQSKFGGTSAYFPSDENVHAARYLTVTNVNGALDLPADFTIECFFYPTTYNNGGGNGGCQCLFAGANDFTYGVMMYLDGRIGMWASSGGGWDLANGVFGSNYVTLNDWNHIAFVRQGSVFTLFLNGQVEAQNDSGVSDPVAAADFRIGVWGNNQSPINDGYVDELRITNGTALYTDNFTPPTAPFSAGGLPAALLLHFDGADGSDSFTDSSNNALMPINSSNALISTEQNQFGGSSGYFSGDPVATLTYEESPLFGFGTGDFTIEMFTYMFSATRNSVVSVGTYANGILWRLTAGDALYLAGNSFYWLNNSGNVSVPLEQWAHVALTRAGTVIRVFVDGVIAFEEDVGVIDLGAAQPLTIGCGAHELASVDAYHGYIDELRIVKGFAVYTANFTPPSAPLSAMTAPETPVTYFYDNSKYHHEVTTSGGARIDLTTVKFGNGSGKFEGDGSFIKFPAETFNFGESDFTIEWWHYIGASSVGSQVGVFGNGRSANVPEGLNCYVYTDGKLRVDAKIDGSWQMPFLGSATDLPLNSWQHFAIVRNGSDYMLFVDGVQNDSYTSTDSINWPNSTDASIGSVAGDVAEFSSSGTTLYIDDLRITKGVARYTADFTPPTREFADPIDTAPVGDPYAEDVVLLLHMDGADGSTVFTDNSYLQNTVTANGSAYISTTESKFGGSSYYNDGAQCRLSASGDLSLGSGDFTVEMWVYLKEEQVVFLADWRGGQVAGDFRPSIYLQNNILNWYNEGTNANTSFSDHYITSNEWHHIAAARENGAVKLFIDGAMVGAAITDSSPYDGQPTFAGFFDGGSVQGSLYGYIDDLRITKGVARYTADFTPPTAAFLNPFVPEITADLLLHFDGANGSTTFTDSSSNALTVTANGNAVIRTAQSKFGGASGYFDGSSRVSFDPEIFHFGTADFTIEMWINATTFSNYPALLGPQVATCAGSLFVVFSDYGELMIGRQPYGWFIIEALGVSTGQWFHLAITCQSGVVRAFVDGTKIADTNVAYDFTLSASASLGTAEGAGDGFTGYIDEFRVIKGTAVYTTDFTPPTQPFIGPFTPKLITGNDLWLDGADSDFTTFNDTVLGWGDMSGSNNNAANADYAPVPTLAISATPTGKNAVHFNGDPNVMQVNHQFNLKNSSGFVVVRQTANDNDYARIISFQPAAGTDFSQLDGLTLNVHKPQGRLELYNASCTGNYNAAECGGFPTTLPIDWTLISYTVDAAGLLKLRINGEEVSETLYADMASMAGAELLLGFGGSFQSPESLQGDIAAVVHYDHKLGVAALAAVEKYLADKFVTAPPIVSSSGTTSLLLHFDGIDGDNQFIDSSPNMLTVTAGGNAQISTNETKFGPTIAYFDFVNNSYLQIASNDAFNLTGDEPFTVEFWMHMLSYADSYTTVITRRTGVNWQWLCGFSNPATRNLYLSANSSGGVSELMTPFELNLNQWYHVAACYQNGTMSLYVDGVLADSGPWAVQPDNGADLWIAQQGSSGEFFHGYIDELRIVKGEAVYTENFTPPTQAFGGPSFEPASDPYSADVKYLNHFTSASDLSTNWHAPGNSLPSFTTAPQGCPNTTALYGTQGVGMYSNAGMDGSGFLPDITQDFTYEFWLYTESVDPSRGANDSAFLVLRSDGGDPCTIVMWGDKSLSINSGGCLPADGAGFVARTAANIVKLGRWQHIALVGKAGQFTALFVDGVNACSVNQSPSCSGNPAYWETIDGHDFDMYANVYMSNMRLTQAARYESNFYPVFVNFYAPVLPVLLLHCDGPSNLVDSSPTGLTFPTPPGVFDTSTKMFGAAAYNCNNQTGFASTTRNVPDLSTGDFTIECWAYRQSNFNYSTLLFLSASDDIYSYFGGLHLCIASSGPVECNNGFSGALQGGGANVGEWTHIAVVRSNGTSTLYVKGVAVSTSTQAPEPGPYILCLGFVPTAGGFESNVIIDEVRIIKQALYTSDFTPPTAPF